MKRTAAALLSSLALGVPLALPHTAHAGQKQVVSYDCGAAGTVEISGLANDATAYPIVNSTQYSTFVGHQFAGYDSAGNLVYWFSDGTQGSVPSLHTCTTTQDGVSWVVQAQLL